jgi:hypothetical protein
VRSARWWASKGQGAARSDVRRWMMRAHEQQASPTRRFTPLRHGRHACVSTGILSVSLLRGAVADDLLATCPVSIRPSPAGSLTGWASRVTAVRPVRQAACACSRQARAAAAQHDVHAAAPRASRSSALQSVASSHALARTAGSSRSRMNASLVALILQSSMRRCVLCGSASTKAPSPASPSRL